MGEGRKERRKVEWEGRRGEDGTVRKRERRNGRRDEGKGGS